MTGRDRLHLLVDELPESEVPTAVRVLGALRETSAAVHAIGEAPLDDEPDDDDHDGGLTEARAQADAGMGISTVELEKRLGLR